MRKLKEIGAAVAVFGLGSMVLNFMDMNFEILMWIDTWGDGVGWAIRGALMAGGAGLFLLGSLAGRGTA